MRRLGLGDRSLVGCRRRKVVFVREDVEMKAPRACVCDVEVSRKFFDVVSYQVGG